MRVFYCLLALVVLTLAVPQPPVGFTEIATGTIVINGTQTITLQYTELFDSTNKTNPQILVNVAITQFNINESEYCSPTLAWAWSAAVGQTFILCMKGVDCKGAACQCQAFPPEYAIAAAGTQTAAPCTFGGMSGVNFNLKETDGTNSISIDVCFNANNQVLGWHSEEHQAATVTISDYVVNKFTPTPPVPTVFTPPTTPVCPPPQISGIIEVPRSRSFNPFRMLKL